MRGTIGVLAWAAGCRGWHDPLPFEECQPYPLECAECSFEDDRDAAGAVRVWECEDEALGVLRAIRRPASDVPAADTHFYDAETGARVASVREHPEAVPVCGKELTVEWWGAILDCVDRCEIDPTLEEADPELEPCEP